MPFRRRGEDDAPEDSTSSTPAFDYEAEFHQAQAEGLAIKRPDKAPETFDTHAAVATSLVELVRDNSGQHEAEELAGQASSVLGGEHAMEMSSVFPESTKGIAERLTRAVGRVMEMPKGVIGDEGRSVTRNGVGVANPTTRDRQQLSEVFHQMSEGIGLIRALSGKGGEPFESLRTAETVLGSLRRDMEEDNPYKPHAAITIDLGILDVAVVVRGYRLEESSHVVNYDFEVVSTIDLDQRQSQQARAGASKEYKPSRPDLFGKPQ